MQGDLAAGSGQQGQRPERMLAGHATALDTAYREVASRLGADTPATVDADGRLHVAALSAVADPASLLDCGGKRCCPASTYPSWCWR